MVEVGRHLDTRLPPVPEGLPLALVRELVMSADSRVIAYNLRSQFPEMEYLDGDFVLGRLADLRGKYGVYLRSDVRREALVLAVRAAWEHGQLKLGQDGMPVVSPLAAKVVADRIVNYLEDRRILSVWRMYADGYNVGDAVRIASKSKRLPPEDQLTKQQVQDNRSKLRRDLQTSRYGLTALLLWLRKITQSEQGA
ncbi:hypothetical protein HYZ70_03910 [Candidatus Curtissbacteria bacterium]|nr:hypothetical protein [Candidatus Curtissbacteria bacterium]